MTSTEAMPLGQAAPRYAELGYRIFPCAQRAKVPTGGSNGLLAATCDTDQIDRWWRDEPHNIGLACDGLLVLDVDLLDGKTKPNPWLTEDRARDLAAAPTQRTWSGGRQYFFRQPAGKHWRNTAGDIAEGVDTRGYGGYVVAPPSFVREGKRDGYYRWAEGCELDVEPHALPEPPAWLVETLDAIEANRGKAKATNGDAKPAAGDKIDEGKRNGTLASMGGTMRRKGFSPDEILAALKQANIDRCQPPLPESEVEQIAASVGRYEPAEQINGHAQPFTTPRIVRLSEVKPTSVRWLWPGRIALGKLTVLCGDPGQGKSQLTIDLAARVTTGNPWPDDDAAFNLAGDVVLLSAEDDVEDTITPRFIAAGGDLEHAIVVQGVDFKLDPKDPAKQRCFNLEQDLPVLEQALDTLENPRLVVIDPAAAYYGQTDSHKGAAVRGTLAPLAELAARRNVAVVTVEHLNKSGGQKAMHRTSGSVAIVAAARAAWLVAPDKADPKRRLFLPIKNNLAANNGGLAFGIVGVGDVSAIAWEKGIVTTTADEALADDKKTKTRDREREWLKKQLAEGPLTLEYLRSQCRETGFSWRTIQRAATDLKVEKFKSGFKSGWSWRLPGEDCQEDLSSQEVASFDVSTF